MFWKGGGTIAFPTLCLDGWRRDYLGLNDRVNSCIPTCLILIYDMGFYGFQEDQRQSFIVILYIIGCWRDTCCNTVSCFKLGMLQNKRVRECSQEKRARVKIARGIQILEANTNPSKIKQFSRQKGETMCPNFKCSYYERTIPQMSVIWN